MRVKSTEIMKQILDFAKEFIRENGRSPYIREIAEEVGIGKGTAYTYLICKIAYLHVSLNDLRQILAQYFPFVIIN